MNPANTVPACHDPSTEHHGAAPKWAALGNDLVVPLPQRHVKVAVIKTQAQIPDGHVVVRDHNSPHDLVLADDQVIDLAEGNVFYSLAACDVRPRQECSSPAKLAYFVDDRAEITTNGHQMGQSLRDLFSLPTHARLIRDFESPTDIEVMPADTAYFADGPVFVTREVESRLHITVNHRVFGEADGVKSPMAGFEVAALVFAENPRATRVRWQNHEGREVGLDEIIDLRPCDEFHVTRCEVVGGYEQSRVDRELELLRAGGAKVTLLTTPVPAVIYHDLPTRPGHEVPATDVLVPLPEGYPGSMLDFAYLPDGSPLIGRVVGSPQDPRITALDRVWRQISYHPHNGGGGPAWNPTKHGLHTYLGELLSWLFNAK